MLCYTDSGVDKMISKKDLLKTMNISYGQLYRWKREGLIPDSWFIKQAVSTGQETYFDENLIIPRIKKILELKDIYQFEEMKPFFDEAETNKTYTFKEALISNRIDPVLLKLYYKNHDATSITELAILALLTKYDNYLNAIDYLNYNYHEVSPTGYELLVLFNDNNYYLLIQSSACLIDTKLKVVIREQIEDEIKEIAKELKGES